MTTEEAVAEFIANTSAKHIDKHTLKRARATITDTIGVALAGSRTPAAAAMIDQLSATGELRADGPSRLVGTTHTAGRSTAALFNGMVGHVLDFDDATRPANAHLSCSVVAALLSVVADDELLSDEFVVAYLLGFEIGAKLGHPLRHGERGPEWHPTGVLGPLACAAAVSKALALDERQIAHALGIAASCSGGLRANLGTMTKPLHAGRAAQASVMAGTLALASFESSGNALDSDMGFYRAFGTSEPETLSAAAVEACASLGSPWEIMTDAGIVMRLYPACAQTAPAIEAAESVFAQSGGEPFESVSVGTTPSALSTLIYHTPTTGLQAKFSLEYVVATALSGRPVDMDAFTDTAVETTDLGPLMQRIGVGVDDRVASSRESAAIVTARTSSGRVIEHLVEFPNGNGRRWLSRDDRLRKFAATAGRVMPESDAYELFALMETPGPGRSEIGKHLSRA